MQRFDRSNDKRMDGMAIRFAVVERYYRDRRSGNDPDVGRYEVEFPGFRNVVRDEFARLEQLDSSTGETVAERVGPYELVREIGRGGQAVVYEAIEPSLDRRVALKVLRVGPAFDRGSLARFNREAQLTSRLEAQGVCPVYGVGESNGIAWIAMRYIPGDTLAQIAANGPVDSERIVCWLIAVLRTLHAVHEVGLVHRDLKPSNVIVGPSGPVILDFGLARDTEHGATLTGEPIGTPAYMAPEQIRGDRVDRRADVYACGILAHELLSGAHPFDAPTRELMLQKNLMEPAPNLTGVPRALVTVVGAALAKDPDRRYRTAKAFADDLERFQNGESVVARQPSIAARCAAWISRNRSLSALVLVLAVALAVSLGLVQQLGTEQRRTSDSLLRMRALGLASAAIEQQHEYPLLGLLLAVRAHETVATAESLSALYQCWDSARVVRELRAGGSPVSAIAAVPDGERVLCGYADGTLRLFDGSETRTLPPHSARVTSVVVGPSGQFATSAADGMVVARDGSGLPIARYDCNASVSSLAFAGRETLVFGDANGAVREWTGIEAGGLPREIWRAPDAITRLVVGPSGKRIVVLTASKSAVVLGRDGAVQATWQTDVSHAAAFADGGDTVVTSMSDAERGPGLHLQDLKLGRARGIADLFAVHAVTSGGRDRVAVGGLGGHAAIVDRARGVSIRLPGHAHVVGQLDFDGDGYLLTGSLDHTMRIFDRDGAVRQVLRGHQAGVTHARFVASGKRVLSAGRDGITMLWERRAPGDLDLGDRRFAGRAFSNPEGSYVAVVVDGGVLLVPRRPELRPVRMRVPGGRALLVSFADDRVLVTMENGRGLLFDRTGRPVASSPRHSAFPCSAVLGDGSAAVTKVGKDLSLWDDTGERSVLRGHGAPILVVAASTDRIVSGDVAGDLRLWAADGTPLAKLTSHEGSIAKIVFSPDGRLVATGGVDGRLHLHDSDGELVVTIAAHRSAVTRIDFSADGTRLVTASEDSTARTWQRDGTPIAVLRGHSGALEAACLSPDGRRAVTVGRGGNCILWAADGTMLARLPRLPRPPQRVEFARDGRSLFVSGLGDRVCVWPLEPGELLRRARARCCRELTPVERVRFAALLGEHAPEGER